MTCKQKYWLRANEGYFRDYLLGCTEPTFLTFLTKLSGIGVLSLDDIDLYRIESKFERAQKIETISRILSPLKEKSQNEIDKFLANLKLSYGSLSSIKNIKFVDETWNDLIKKVKESRIEDSSNIVPLSSAEGHHIKLSNVLTSIEICEEKTVNTFETFNINSNLSYRNFHTVFNRKFKRILIKGEPGMGKSVQVKYLLSGWANNEWNVENTDTIVLFIILRNVEKGQDLFDCLLKQNFPKQSYMTKEILKDLYTSNSSDILLFLDGADAYCLNETTILNAIESGDNNIKTVIWSRNWKTEKIKINCNYVFELTGLCSNQLEQFFKKYFTNSDDAQNFLSQLNSQSLLVKQLCRVPLLSTIMLILWLKNNHKFEETLYQIFEKYFEIIFPKSESKDGKSINLINYLEKLSYTNLNKSEITVDKTIQNFSSFKNSENLLEIYRHEHSADIKAIRFYHLSLQEFLAARYIIRERIENKNEYVFSDEYISSIGVDQLFNVLEFIRQFSLQKYDKLIKTSRVLKRSINGNIKFLNLMKNGLGFDKSIIVEKNDMSNRFFEMFLKKIGQDLLHISLHLDIKITTAIKIVGETVPNLKTLSLFTNSSDKRQSGDPSVFHSIINLILLTKKKKVPTATLR